MECAAVGRTRSLQAIEKAPSIDKKNGRAPEVNPSHGEP